MIKGIIFDADGTLLDSMFIWREAAERYLIKFGISLTEEIYNAMFTMSLEESSIFLKEEFRIPLSPDEIKAGILAVIEDFYKNEVQLKNGVADFLDKLHKRKIKILVATSGDKDLITAAFRRLGIIRYFSHFISCTELNTSKRESAIYLHSAKILGTSPSETAVFEDVLHAIKCAKKEGFFVVGVEDAESSADKNEISETAELYLHDFTDFSAFAKYLHLNTSLSIAGSDSSGGAGIQADIKTMTANGVYAMTAITALTAQNTTGVTAIQESTPEFLKQQIDSVFEDIYPDSVKIGMVSSAKLIEVISERLRFYRAKNIVVDPVMVATSGSELMKAEAVTTLRKELLPIAALVTPNIPEAEALSGMPVRSKDDMLTVAKILGDTHGCAVLLKGGHSVNDANDLLYFNGKFRWFEGKRIDNSNTHGTGCTLSSAIASNLAKGFLLEEAVLRAKEYISGALGAMLDLGHGSGPLNHMFNL